MSTLTPSNNPESPTLFSIANRLYREGKYAESVLIYEFLAENEPNFSCYAENDAMARRALKRQNRASKVNVKFHLGNASEYQKRLRIADVISYLYEPHLVDVALAGNIDDAQHWLTRAAASISADYQAWLDFTNRYLGCHDRAPLSLLDRSQWSGAEPYLNLRPSKLAAVNGPLVTICMSCFNAEPYVEHAVRSLLNQSYTNLELLVFNDKSQDGTLSILRRLEKEDSRIKVIDNEVNQGTYVSRNQALQRAKGEFFTVMDADDFALPERIAVQVNHLQKNPGHVGVMTEWVRMQADGHFHFKPAWGGGYQHEAVATLMIRASQVREKIGYWDSVRFAADTEFLFRLYKAYGNEAAPLLKSPTVISLFHEASLTNDPVTGINVAGIKGLSPTRKKYRNSWRAWQEEAGDNLYMPFPLEKRLFPAPDEMLPMVPEAKAECGSEAGLPDMVA